MHYACKVDSTEIVIKLCENGADVTINGHYGTCFDICKNCNQMKHVEHLRRYLPNTATQAPIPRPLSIPSYCTDKVTLNNQSLNYRAFETSGQPQDDTHVLPLLPAPASSDVAAKNFGSDSEVNYSTAMSAKHAANQSADSIATQLGTKEENTTVNAPILEKELGCNYVESFPQHDRMDGFSHYNIPTEPSTYNYIENDLPCKTVTEEATSSPNAKASHCNLLLQVALYCLELL